MSNEFRCESVGARIEELEKSNFPAGVADENGAYPFYCSSSIVRRIDYAVTSTPAILMGTGGVATVHLGKGKYSYSTDVWAFRVSDAETRISFLYRQLEFLLPRIDYSAFEGSGLKHLNKNYIRHLLLPVPCLARQEFVERVLDRVDALIDETELIIHKIRLIKDGLVCDMLERGILSDGTLRPAKIAGAGFYKDSPLGWIPKDWNVSKLCELASPMRPVIKTGPFGSSLKGVHWRSSGRPVVTIGSLGEGAFIESELLYIDEETASDLREYSLLSGDILFSRVADVGRSVVVSDKQEGWIMSSNFMRVSCDPRKIRPEFLQLLISASTLVRRGLRATVNSSGRDVANSEVLMGLLFPVPSLYEQDLILREVDGIGCFLNEEEEVLKKLFFIKSCISRCLLLDCV